MVGRPVRSWMATARVISRNLRHYKFEPEVAYLKDVIQPDDICLHIGASDGRHTLVMARLAKRGYIYCFEPSSYSYEILKRAVAFHGLTNVTCFNVALMDRLGQLDLVVPVKASGRLGHSFGHVASAQENGGTFSDIQMEDAVTEPTQAVTLDAFCERNLIEKIDFIRCDVEGAELKVLKGGEHIIDRNLPNALIEIHPHALKENFDASKEEVFDFFKSRNYEAYCLKNGTLKRVDAVIDEPWRDYFFLHPSRGVCFR
ncbi:MAG: FkbM family methyltransferase [Alphaproteobacteria bacterium]